MLCRALYVALHCAMLRYVALCRTLLPYFGIFCPVLRYVALCCTLLPYIA